MTKIKTFGVFIFITFCLNKSVLGQGDPKSDSLLKVYNSNTPDSNKLKALSALFTKYQSSNDSLASKYVTMGVSFGSKSNDPKGYAMALCQKGRYEGRHGNYDSSEFYLSKAYEKFKAINDQKGLAQCKMSFGLNCYDQSKHKEALTFFLEALKFFEQVKDQRGISSAYNWIGNVYNNGLIKPEEALDYYMNALKINLELNDIKGLASVYNNLGNVNYFLKKYKEALLFYKKSTELKEKLNDRSSLSNSYNNLGNVSAALKNFDQAIDYFKKAMAIYEEFGDESGSVTENINIGNVCFDERKYKEAIAYYTKAFDIATKIEYREGLKEAAYALAIAYEDSKHPLEALKYFKLSSAINDSIINTDFNDQIVEMEAKYQSGKKELENKDLKNLNTIKELEIGKQKQGNFVKTILLISVVVLLILISISGSLFYNKKKIQLKAELDAEISKQKELRIKAVIETEEKERIRIARDLHDGIGQLLSAAKMNFSSIEKQLEIKGVNQQGAFKNALDLLDESVKEVRAVSHNMMPNILLKLGLASAVKEFITKIQNMPELKVNLEIIGMNNRVEQEKESILYRVIQEVVANIIRHAKASELGLQMIRHEKELTIIIEDNGVGFDTSKINDFTGIGLKNIISRVEFINGTVNFDSLPGRGTIVLIDVPIS